MFEWTDANEWLPEPGRRVLARTISTFAARMGQPGPASYHVASLCVGKIPKPGETICWADAHGNNHLPYRWSGDGPMSWDGEDVTHWRYFERVFEDD